MLVCVSFEVGMTLQFGHAYTDPRTLPSYVMQGALGVVLMGMAVRLAMVLRRR
jgi:hypothetical protein